MIVPAKNEMDKIMIISVFPVNYSVMQKMCPISNDPIPERTILPILRTFYATFVSDLTLNFPNRVNRYPIIKDTKSSEIIIIMLSAFWSWVF